MGVNKFKLVVCNADTGDELKSIPFNSEEIEFVYGQLKKIQKQFPISYFSIMLDKGENNDSTRDDLYY